MNKLLNEVQEGTFRFTKITKNKASLNDTVMREATLMLFNIVHESILLPSNHFAPKKNHTTALKRIKKLNPTFS